MMCNQFSYIYVRTSRKLRITIMLCCLMLVCDSNMEILIISCVTSWSVPKSNHKYDSDCGHCIEANTVLGFNTYV